MTQNVEDLSVLSRRGSLSEAERLELEGAFEAAPEERFWHEAACALDDEDALAANDSAAVARVLERLAQPKPAQGKVVPLRRRAPVWLLAAAAALVAAAATAAIVSVRRASDTAQAVPSATPAPSKPALREREVEAPPAVESVQAVPSSAAPTPGASAPIIGSPPLVRSAAELLSDAGRARREGHAAQAASLLESLQARFPGSPEALTSDITLGALKLQSGSASSALQHFDRYLKRAPRGNLAPEAMWGRAQALSRLGNRAAARQTLSELLQRYPSSPYVSSASAKLHALDQAP